MNEQQAEYIMDAVEMLGAGYEHPAIEIEQARTVIERRGGKMQEVERPAFVKISTAFKRELPSISGDALKVWLFISLSINRSSGKANPGLRTIAAGINLAVNTVQKCLQELEGLELLVVDRESRKFNIYETPEYVSANRRDPVSSFDTDGETVSNPAESVSNNPESVSPAVILNQINQRNQIDKKPEKTAKRGDWVDGLLAMNGAKEKELSEVGEILQEFERQMKRRDDLAGDSAWQDFARGFVRKERAAGRDYRLFLNWYTSDPVRMNWAWKETPRSIKARWLMAFDSQVSLSLGDKVHV